MANPVLNIVRGVARTPLLPAKARAGYALVMKRAWKLLPSPVETEVDGIGKMQLYPWDFLDARLFFFNVWEPAITRFMRNQIRPGSVVVDIGANIGYYTLLMSRAVGPMGRVYSVEPSPEIRARLETNLALNEISNVTVVPYGISDRTERRSFTLSKSNMGASHFGEASEDGLELRRLEEVVAEADLPLVEFIKIDVEGMEVHVMRDILGLVPRLSSRLALGAEVRMSDEMRALIADYQAADFRTLLLDNNYNMFSYPNRHLPQPKLVETLGDGQLDVALVRN